MEIVEEQHERPEARRLLEERAQLAPIRRLADEIIDTSDMNVHELREAFMARSLGTSRTGALSVTFLSFGFKYGLPLDADLVFDVRFLPNPHFVEALRPLDGRDARVREFILKHEASRELLTRLPDLEPAGEPERLASSFIAGVKHMPVRFTPGARSAP